MQTDQLKKWMSDKDVINETFKAFRECFNNYISEYKNEFVKYFGGYDKCKLNVYFDKVALKIKSLKHFDQENEDYEFVEVCLNIKYYDNGIGYYGLLFDLSGKPFDDFLVIDYKQRYIFQRIDILYEIKEEIFKEIDHKSLDVGNQNTNLNILTDKIDETRRNIILYKTK